VLGLDLVRPITNIFPVLALDARLDVPSAATCDEVFQAAERQVTGKGSLVGTYQQIEPSLK
jgi:hypothetical protein